MNPEGPNKKSEWGGIPEGGAHDLSELLNDIDESATEAEDQRSADLADIEDLLGGLEGFDVAQVAMPPEEYTQKASTLEEMLTEDPLKRFDVLDDKTRSDFMQARHDFFSAYDAYARQGLKRKKTELLTS